MSSENDILKNASEAKALFSNESFKRAVKNVENGLNSAILNCRFENKGDGDKLILSVQLFNRLLSSIKKEIEFGESEEINIANELLREKKANEIPIFNRDVE